MADEITAFGRKVEGITQARARTDALTLSQMYPEIRARAFAVQGIDDFAQLKRIQDKVAELSVGGKWNELRDSIADELGGDTAGARRHAETVLRTNGFQAYGAARWKAQQARKDVFPYLKYVTMDDGRVRDSHAQLDGVILPIDDPFWENHYPPWGFNCRCMAVQMSEAGLEDEREAGEGDLWNPASRDHYVATYKARDETNQYQFRPGSLEIDVRSLAQAKGRTPADMEQFGKMMEGRKIGTGEFGADGKEIETNVREWLFQPVRREYTEKLIELESKDGNEHAFAVDSWTGEEKGYVPGTRSQVDLRHVPVHNEQSLSVFHNHPGGNYRLSPADVIGSMRPDVKELTAVSATGWMQVRATARSEQMKTTLREWRRRFEAAGSNPVEFELLKLEWLNWLAKQTQYGYFEISRGGTDLI